MNCRIVAYVAVGVLQLSCCMHAMNKHTPSTPPMLTKEQANKFVPYMLAKHPTHNVIAAAVRNSDDETDTCLGLYDAKTRDLLALFESRDSVGAPTCIAYSPDGTTLSVGNNEGDVQCWRVVNKKVDCTKYLCGMRIEDITWNATGTYLAVLAEVSGRQRIIIVDGKTFKVLKNVEPKVPLRRLSYSPSVLETLATLSAMRVNTTRQSSVDILAISKDNTQIISSFKAGGVLLGKMCYSARGDTLALAGAAIEGSGLSRKSNACIYVLNMLRGNEYVCEKLPDAPAQRVIALTYAPQADRFICCTDQGKIALYTAGGAFTNSALCKHKGSDVEITDCAIIKDEAERIELALATSKGLKTITVKVEPYEMDVSQMVKEAATSVWNFLTK